LYKQRQQELGADMTQLKPPHINPADETVEFLLAAIKVPLTSKEMVMV
jgi:hypothetical protein